MKVTSTDIAGVKIIEPTGRSMVEPVAHEQRAKVQEVSGEDLIRVMIWNR